MEGWKSTLLYFPDEPVGHTISPSTAKAVQEFYQSLARAYAYLLYHEPNATLLHADDKEALEFRALVTDGSSGIEIASHALDTLVEGLLTKMSGDQEFILVIVFLLLFFGSTTTRAWLRHRYEAKREATDSSERIALSEQETRRTELLTRVISIKGDLSPLVETSDDAKIALVRGAAKVEHASIIDTEIDREVAQTILSKKREKGEGKRLEGKFEFIWIGNEHEGGFVGRVRSYPDNAEISVEINYLDLTADDMNAVFDSLRHETLVRAHINAWYVGGKIVRAVVMKADKNDS